MMMMFGRGWWRWLVFLIVMMGHRGTQYSSANARDYFCRVGMMFGFHGWCWWSWYIYYSNVVAP